MTHDGATQVRQTDPLSSAGITIPADEEPAIERSRTALLAVAARLHAATISGDDDGTRP